MGTFETIATYDQAPDAHLLKSFLESEGIEAFVLGEHTAGLHYGGGAMGGGIGGMVRVQVYQQDYDAALELLQQYEEGEILEPESESRPGLALGAQFVAEAQGSDNPESEVLCPKCGSDLVYPEQRSPVVMAWIILLLFIPLLFRRKKLECSSCGAVWEP